MCCDVKASSLVILRCSIPDRLSALTCGQGSPRHVASITGASNGDPVLLLPDSQSVLQAVHAVLLLDSSSPPLPLLLQALVGLDKPRGSVLSVWGLVQGSDSDRG